jgi:putative glutathione S-transferase
MGLLVDGKWTDEDGVRTEDGRFIRPPSPYRNWITNDGSPGPSGEGGFKAEAGRYHLYVSHNCPWAYRAVVFRKLMGLEDVISLAISTSSRKEEGWTYTDEPGCLPDAVNGVKFLHQAYTKADPHFTGRVLVPALWDKQKQTIVNNESSEIIRMFNAAFDGIGAARGDYYPLALRDEIDSINARVYETVNNGVYKCGFATSQEAYEEAIDPLFETLDWLEGLLAERTYLLGDTLTEADWRLFTTLIRFDPVYVGHFKCNKRRIVDYPNLSRLTVALYAYPGVATTVNMAHIKHHYYGSHESINPSRIVPAGPASYIGAT